MPQMNWFSWLTWIAVIVFQPVLVCIMVRSGAWRRWLSLFSLVIVFSLHSFVLLGITLFDRNLDSQAFAYFWTYWGGCFLCEVLQVCVIVQLAEELIGISRRAKRWIRNLVPAMALLNLVFSTAISLDNSSHFYSKVVYIVGWMDRSSSLALLVTFLFIALGSERLGIEWAAEARGVGLGFAIDALGSSITGWVSNSHILPLSILSDIKGALFAVALSHWCRNLSHPVDPDALPTAQQLNQSLNSQFLKMEGRP